MKRYLPIGGLKEFVTESVKLAFGDACPELSTVAAVQVMTVARNCRPPVRIPLNSLLAPLTLSQVRASQPLASTKASLSPPTTKSQPITHRLPNQSLSGTGSCRLMAEFQRRYMPHASVYIPVPTWSNHHNIWKDAGVPQVRARLLAVLLSGLRGVGVGGHLSLRSLSPKSLAPDRRPHPFPKKQPDHLPLLQALDPRPRL
jgi:hypothetical protein